MTLLFFTAYVHKRVLGLEAVVFVGGVSLGQQATSIPIAAITGLIAGLLIGVIVYQFASRSSKLHFICAEAERNLSIR